MKGGEKDIEVDISEAREGNWEGRPGRDYKVQNYKTQHYIRINSAFLPQIPFGKTKTQYYAGMSKLFRMRSPM